MAEQRSSDQDGTRFAENTERLKELRKRERRLLEELEENQEDEAEVLEQFHRAGARLEKFRSRRERVESRLEYVRREMNELRGIEATPQLSAPVPAAQEAPTKTATSSTASVQEVPTGEKVAVKKPSITEIVVTIDGIYIEENLPITEVGQDKTLDETTIEEAQAAEDAENEATDAEEAAEEAEAEATDAEEAVEEAEAEATDAEEAAEEAEAEATHAEVEAAIAEKSAEEARGPAIIAEGEAGVGDGTSELGKLAEEEATEAVAPTVGAEEAGATASAQGGEIEN